MCLLTALGLNRKYEGMDVATDLLEAFIFGAPYPKVPQYVAVCVRSVD